MSKSIHQTTKGVFGGKGKKEITQMCRPGSLDPDVEALLKKARYKHQSGRGKHKTKAVPAAG